MLCSVMINCGSYGHGPPVSLPGVPTGHSLLLATCFELSMLSRPFCKMRMVGVPLKESRQVMLKVQRAMTGSGRRGHESIVGTATPGVVMV